MEIKSVAGDLSDHSAETLVIFTAQDGEKLFLDCKSCGCDDGIALIQDAFKHDRFKASAKEALFFRGAKPAEGYKNLLVVGLGPKKSVTEETLRQGAAVTVKALKKEKSLNATLCLNSLRRLTSSAGAAGSALAEGLALASYKYDELKTAKKESDKKTELETILLVLNDKAALKKFSEGVETGKILADATCFARDLGNAPSNILPARVLADRARAAAKGLPIKFQALTKKEIQALKMGCLLGVNAGSVEEPRFIIMEYWGGKKSDAPVILVGKGLTFDSGGISIKPSANMEEMKFDMCGSAAVIGSIIAAATLKLKVNMITLVASTDNKPSGSAINPGDVLTSMNGKTIEVNNTDAEGRLVLADALTYACREYKPKAIIDAATLTGACAIALGNVYAGVFTKDEKLMKKIAIASESSGEKIWRLPLSEEYLEDLKGTYADLNNISGGKGGGASHGAAFLSEFVEKDIPWAHFDIAGVAWNTGSRKNYNPDKGASGSMVRLFTHLASTL